MTILIKHSQLGNKHVSADEAQALTLEDWVIWPRSKEQKAGIVPVVIPAAILVIEQPVKRKPGRPRKA